jgi:hypothetical protein
MIRAFFFSCFSEGHSPFSKGRSWNAFFPSADEIFRIYLDLSCTDWLV